ncbi:hypothetical protein PSET11_03224 [Arthrobacter ulcerisalmonis]|uniref:Tetratricopeptide repeat protein n=1 Tax=Arthrobacter ulcerisalmonis TaxID=2483813 RepID=A0A3P5XMZ0_9MICC|nr:hypothetical protein [Arthrobacter ulcerisalmonis]VDC33099.1 hypothetical protein PSET11_03224 [Arthrobacter ulcerisalmonis]
MSAGHPERARWWGARGSRRRLLLASAIPVLLALLLAVKLLSVGFLAGAAGTAFERGDAAGVRQAADGLLLGNILEPFKADFAAGDALALAGDFAGARERFQRALDQKPGTDECTVRVNLVLATERLAEQTSTTAGGEERGRELRGEALAVVEQSPAACFQDTSSNDAGQGQQLSAARERLQAAGSGDAGGNTSEPTPPDEPSEPAPADASRLNELERKAQDALRERLESEARNEYLDRSDTGPRVEKPW